MIEAQQLIIALRQVMAGNLPGEQAHLQILPEKRNLMPVHENPVEAAVLLLLYPKKEDWHIVFMKRNEYPGHHSGQVSFPGGKVDGIDKSLKETALRETREEMGIETRYLLLAGALTPLHIPVSGYYVHPFVAVSASPLHFKPDPAEVQYLIETPIVQFSATGVKTIKIMRIRGEDIRVPCFQHGSETIWGATAMILNEFLAVYEKINSR